MQAQENGELDRRTRKRLSNRRVISDAATRLFMEHGFDRVTVDQIADAADVGRMTVFNHFPRKEDMFFDREEEACELAFAAIRDREDGTNPIEALRLLAHRLIANRNYLLPMFQETRWFVSTALASEALKARARQMRSAFEARLAAMLAEAASRPPEDAEAHLYAGMLVATWSVAFARGYEALASGANPPEAERTFLQLIDRGTDAVEAAAAATSYTATQDR